MSVIPRSIQHFAELAFRDSAWRHVEVVRDERADLFVLRAIVDEKAIRASVASAAAKLMIPRPMAEVCADLARRNIGKGTRFRPGRKSPQWR